MNITKSFVSGLRQYMRKAARHSGGMDSYNQHCWRGKRLHHHGGDVCHLFVLLWMDSWCHDLIVCKKWYKNNLKMRLTALLSDQPSVHHTSEVQSKMIFMGHQILSFHVPVVRSFFILWKMLLSSWNIPCDHLLIYTNITFQYSKISPCFVPWFILWYPNINFSCPKKSHRYVP